MHHFLYTFICASFGAEQFRRWIRSLAVDDPSLVLELDAPIDAATLFDRGAALLIARGYVDAALFASLLRTFPRKTAQVAALAEHCGVQVYPELRALLRAEFSATQLRAWLHGHAPMLIPRLHVQDDLVHDAGVDALLGAGRIDAPLFASLARERPKRTAELNDLARRCGVSGPIAASPRTTMLVFSSAALVVLVTAQITLANYDDLNSSLPQVAESGSGTDPTAVPVATSDPRPSESTEPTIKSNSESQADTTTTASRGTADVRRPDGRTAPRVVTEPNLGKKLNIGHIETPPERPDEQDARCDLSTLQRMLEIRSSGLITNAAIDENFTVTVPSSDSGPIVSPKPTPGEVSREQLYKSTLKAAAALPQRCRGVQFALSFKQSGVEVNVLAP
jgi:hypothetical protein